MPSSRSRHPAPLPGKESPVDATTGPGTDGNGDRRRSSSLVLALLAVFAVIAGISWYLARSRPATIVPATVAIAPARYVGADTCATCHAAQEAAWKGSQHAQSMQYPSPETVRGSFAASFFDGGVKSTFFRKDDRYWVSTDGPAGTLAEFEIKYTFGIEPLQQYLVELPGGRLQALGIAWDARSTAAGGQRWFHLYPGRKLRAGDPLHWTGIDQNWNYQCADCHSTNVRKGFDETTRTFKTTWSDISVGCEACHGPGSNHVAWAGSGAERRAADRMKGLVIALDERAGITWSIQATSGNAVRSRERATNAEIETCARCHSRRGQFSDTWTPGQPIGDAFRVALIEPGLYYPDGQMRDEVFNYGSFLQSRMHAKGVTCADCHDPHTQALRAAGNAVCGQCHAPARYDVADHHHHAPGTPGASCASCHMPATTYMVVDSRHDHSMRIPRPDRTLSLGVPNACDACHAKQGAKWSAAAVARWYPNRKPGYQTFAEAFDAGDRRAPGSGVALTAVIADAAQPPIVRASAIPRLVRNAGPSTVEVISAATGDSDPLVREVAARTLRDADPVVKARVLPPLLADPVRAVRMEAARGLAGQSGWRPASAGEKVRFDSSLEEYAAALRFNADRSESAADFGSLHLALGRPDAAIDSYRRALEIDPAYAPAAINLADLYRSRGLEKEAESTLAAAARADPRAAAPRHALGLSFARQKRMPEALAALGEAARLAPDDARFAYVYAVALHDTGRRSDAIRVLERALARHPYDREMLVAAALYDREAGNRQRALGKVRLLIELEPDNGDLQRMAQEISSSGRDKR